MSGCGRTLFWIGFTERTISNLKHSTHSIYSKLSTIVVPRQNGPCQEKNRLFYDFLPGSTTFVLWRTAKTWMQPSTKTKDTFEPSNETVFDEKTVHGRKQMYKWECKAAGRAFLGYNLSVSPTARQLPWWGSWRAGDGCTGRVKFSAIGNDRAPLFRFTTACPAPFVRAQFRSYYQ